VWTVYHIARRLGIEKALGTTREGKLDVHFISSSPVES
jgi:hypothetical protein